MKYRCVIFDLDGTLADTIADIASSMNRALLLNALPPVPQEDYPQMVGWGMHELAAKAVSRSLQIAGAAGEDASSPAGGEIVSKVAADAARLYAEQPIVLTASYPGIGELLSVLRQKKVILAVLSNKPDPATRLVVNGLFPSLPFALVRGDIAGTPRKPDPASVWDMLAELDKTPGETIFAGDSEIDMQTARAAGCYPLGVSWGFRPRRVLEESGAAKIIDSPLELAELFL